MNEPISQTFVLIDQETKLSRALVGKPTTITFETANEWEYYFINCFDGRVEFFVFGDDKSRKVYMDLIAVLQQTWPQLSPLKLSDDDVVMEQMDVD
jgi:hypothetical protein